MSMNKVIVQPNGIGGTAGTWAKSSSDTFVATADLGEAMICTDTTVAGVIATMDPNGALGLYSSNPTTPPPPPPGL